MWRFLIGSPDQSVVDCTTVIRDTCSDDIAAAHKTIADGGVFVLWFAITITLKLKGRSRKTAKNIKIQLKSGLKIAHYIAEVKR